MSGFDVLPSGIWVKVYSIPCPVTTDTETIHQSFVAALNCKGQPQELQYINTSLGVVPCSSSISRGGSKPIPCIQADVQMNIPCKDVITAGNWSENVSDALKASLSVCDLPKDTVVGLLVYVTYTCDHGQNGYRVYYYKKIKGKDTGIDNEIDVVEDKISALQLQLKQLKSRL